MASQEKPKLDRRDLAILAALQRDGRLTNEKLAAEVALAPSACLRRRRALEKLGIIRAYRADIATERIGPCVALYAEIRLARHGQSDFERFERAIARQSAVVEAVQLGGDADYLLKVVVADLEAWRRINDTLVAQTDAAITVKTGVVLKVAKPFVGYPLFQTQE